MSIFNVGKFRVSTSSFGARGPGPHRVNGHWYVYDMTSESGDPVIEGVCAEERDNDAKALADADVAGRLAAEGLILERRSFGDHGETAA